MYFLKSVLIFLSNLIVSTICIQEMYYVDIKSPLLAMQSPKFGAEHYSNSYLQEASSDIQPIKIKKFDGIPSTALQPPKLPSEYKSSSERKLPELSQDLQLPEFEPFNPNNDPFLFYQNYEDTLGQHLGKKEKTPKKYNSNEKLINKNPKLPIIEKHSRNDVKKNVVTKKNNSKNINLKPTEVFEPKDIARNDKIASKNHLKKSKTHPKKYNTKNEDKFHEIEYTEDLEEQTPEASQFFNEETKSDIGGGNNERLQFHMQNHNGPKSYKFGFDTGKGHERQFRYEERDKDGHVTGHYGYYDKTGKLQMYHYDASPEGGFHSHPIKTDE